MAVRSFRSLAFCTGALGALALTQACADDGVSLHVTCPVPPTISSMDCTYDAASMLCVLEGVMNLASTGTYATELKVQSGLRARARDVPPQGEPNGVQVRSASVELRLPTGERLDFQADADGKKIENPFNVVVSGYITPGGSNIVGVQMVTAAHAVKLWTSAQDSTPRYPQIVAAVKIQGRTDGMEDVESGEWLWPIHLVSLSPLRADKRCQADAPSCGRIGQDGFAAVCID